MKYKIVVDKQSRTNPSADRREYEIDIEELRYKGDVHDSLIITKDEDYVMRRLELTQYFVLKELEEPIKEPLPDVNIELFEGDNYIYLIDMAGNKFFAEYLIKNDFVENYTLKSEFNTAMNQTSQKIELMASSKLDKDEFATYLEVNSDAVKVAWNKIAEYIQMMILNGSASLAVLDENKDVLMSLDKTGQHFNEQGQKFGDMGVIAEEKGNDTNKFIAFSVDGEYDSTINNGMAWGIRTKSDNKFYPIFYIKDFYIPPKNSEGVIGDLVLSSGRFILEGINALLEIGGISINGDELDGIFFTGTGNNEVLLHISKGNVVDGASIDILDKIRFFKNKAGSNTFRIGEENGTRVSMTDAGELYATHGTFDDIYCYGEVACKEVRNTSQAEKKCNIEKYDNSALKELLNTDIYYYNYKDDDKGIKRRVGAVIGKKYKCSKEIIATDGKGIDLYSMISVSYKATQEQQGIIENLIERIAQQQSIIENQQEIINNLLARVEKLEAINSEQN